MKTTKFKYYKVKQTQKNPVFMETIIQVPEGVEVSERIVKNNNDYFDGNWGQVSIYEYDSYTEHEYSISIEEMESEEGSKEWNKTDDPHLCKDGVLRWWD